MQKRYVLGLGVVVLGLLLLPSIAWAAAPRLLSDTSFAVKPAVIGNITGDGSALIGRMPGRGGADPLAVVAGPRRGRRGQRVD